MDSHSLPLRDQLKCLENLQEVDLKIDALKKQKLSLPDVLKTLNETFLKVTAQVTVKKTALSEIEKTIRQAQAALELNRDRLLRSHEKLESVHNSQEFQAANKEIDQLKKLSTTLDEQVKKSKQDEDALLSELLQLEESLAKAQAEREAQNLVVQGEAGQLDGKISELQTERNKFTSVVDKRILAQYDRVRVARNGVGFVPTSNGRCSGCHMMVPPQLVNEIVKFKNVQSCPSCHRILTAPSA